MKFDRLRNFTMKFGVIGLCFTFYWLKFLLTAGYRTRHWYSAITLIQVAQIVYLFEPKANFS